jgi:acetyl-CoA C-acetyltransferase
LIIYWQNEKGFIMARDVAIVGTGQTHHQNIIKDANMVDMVDIAVNRALEDAGLTMKDIDAVLIGNMEHFEGINNVDMWQVDGTGSYMKHGMKITTGGTSGSTVAMAAYYHIKSGLFDTVLAIGWEKQSEGDTTTSLITAADPIWERAATAGALGCFGAWSYWFMTDYNLTLEQAAKVAAKNRQNGLKNPYAHLKLDITVEDVMKSPMLAFPIRQLDMCPASDGAAALIYASGDKAKKITDKPVWVAAAATAHDMGFAGDVPAYTNLRSLSTVAKKVYRKAGIKDPSKDIDVFEAYEPSSWSELSIYEALGVCEPGKCGELIDSGKTYLDGEMPFNPSGGVLCTNCIGASAMLRVVEAAIQIRGQGGDRQVEGVETAMATGFGGNWWSDAHILKKTLG